MKPSSRIEGCLGDPLSICSSSCQSIGASAGALTISVVIPVYNGGREFVECLHGLRRTVPPPSEIIVVANGVTDGSGEVAKDAGAHVVSLPGPVGPARARNIGARHASGTVLLFIDADVYVPPDIISKVAASFARDPAIVALIGSYDDQPAARNFLSQYRNLLHHYIHQTSKEEASTFWGACGAIRRDAFMAMKGFDERYSRPSIEDIELGYRLKRAGHRLRLCKALQVKHLKRWTPQSMIRTDVCDRAIPWTELILRERKMLNDLNLRHASRLSVVASFGLLGSLIGVWSKVEFGVAGALFASLLLCLNLPFYRFLLQSRGLRFTVQTIPWHWTSFLYSGAAFGLGGLLFVLRRCRVARAGPRVAPGS